MRLDVLLTAESAVAHPPEAATVLVIDVLRASTTIIAALAHGCSAVIIVADADEARRRARAVGPTAVIAGERRGEPLAGFDLGNSPREFTAERVGGRTVILTTSNGTRALLAARSAPAVGVAALVNLGAAAAWALAQGRDVVALCAGERGAPSLEDHVCAGLLLERLAGEAAGAELSPAALEAVVLGRRYGKDVARLAADSPWARHLSARGHGADVTTCLVLDTTARVPVMRAGVDNIVELSR